MKIAIFTDIFDEPDDLGITYQKLMEYAAVNNKEVELFTYGKINSVERINKKVKIHHIKAKVPLVLAHDLHFDAVWFDKYLWEYFRENKFDLLHSATPGSMGLNALFLAKMLHLPLVGSYHPLLSPPLKMKVETFLTKSKWQGKKLSHTLAQTLENYLHVYYHQCDALLVPSEEIKKNLAKNFQSEIAIFSRGVDTKQFHPRFRTKYFKKWYGVKTAALYVGSITQEKNLDLLIDVFMGLPEVKLFVVGDGPYRKDLEEKLDAEFIGFKKGDTLSKFYANCDFFVFPSLQNTIGSVVLEAMASGLPVIVTNKVEPQELIKEGVNGFIVNPSVKEFSEKVKILTYSGRIRKNMSKKARDVASQHEWNLVFEELFKVYEKTRAHSLAVMRNIS